MIVPVKKGIIKWVMNQIKKTRKFHPCCLKWGTALKMRKLRLECFATAHSPNWGSKCRLLKNLFDLWDFCLLLRPREWPHSQEEEMDWLGNITRLTYCHQLLGRVAWGLVLWLSHNHQSTAIKGQGDWIWSIWSWESLEGGRTSWQMSSKDNAQNMTLSWATPTTKMQKAHK